MPLDKNSPVPLYYQLAEWIRERIDSGELKPGDQLPSERELSEQTGISRMTVRQGVAFVVRQGTLVVKPGLGTFIAEPKLTHDALHLLGFTEEMIRQGWGTASQVLEQTVLSAPPRVAGQLDLSPGASVVKIVRLRLAQKTPLLLETVYVPAALCPGLEAEDLVTNSLYAMLEQKHGLRPKRARQSLESTIANDYEASLLGVEPGTAMILLEGVAYLDHDRPVEYFKAVYRGDRFKFELDSERNTWAYEVPGVPRVSVVLT